MSRLQAIHAALAPLGSPAKAAAAARFFKTGACEYAEGDIFLGVAVPQVRRIAKQHLAATLPELDEVLSSSLHEVRLCALLILCEQFKRANDEAQRQAIVEFYLCHAERVNNWDLVDCSAHIILGTWLMDKPRDLLRNLLSEPLLWRKRIALVACWQFIRHGDFADIFQLTKQFIAQSPRPHDLLQKACGWMLREVDRNGGKAQLCAFLDGYAAKLPRTTLRYAIERMTAEERKHYMSIK